MNNELGRKITSLTIMAIMVAGGMTFAIPGVMPAAHAANPNLFVSAENSQFNNFMTGAQVIEVVIIDGDIKDTDEAKGEPDVTLNGEKLAMAQATDGNWYAYFAHESAARAADVNTCQGLDFGVIAAIGGVETEATAIATPDPNCATTHDHEGINVLRETKSLNIRNIDALNGAQWPLIQLFELNPTGNVVIQYNKAGGAQTTTLTYDTVDGYAGLELDRTAYPQSAQVHATVTDVWLNIDPTDEDSWTWDTETGATYYQVFNENGGATGNTFDRDDRADVIDGIMFEDSKLLLTLVEQGNSDVIRLQDNSDTDVYDDGMKTSNTLTAKLASPVTLTEQGPNTGIFGTYDEADDSILVITDDAKRGTSATIDYNDTPATVLVRHGFATVSIQPTTEGWASGEAIPVVVFDTDANKNSRVDEDMTLSDPNIELIPSLSTGDPFTLGEGDKPEFLTIPSTSLDIVTNSGTGGAAERHEYILGAVRADNSTVVGFKDTLDVQRFSERAMLDVSDATSTDIGILIVDLDTTLGELRASINNAHTDTESGFRGTNLLNIDLRSFDAKSVDVSLLVSISDDNEIINENGLAKTKSIWLVNDTGLQSLVPLNDPLNNDDGADINRNIFNNDVGNGESKIGLLFEFDRAHDATVDGTLLPFVADFFSFGFYGDGSSASDRVANQIIRLELEEDADNSSTFMGSLEYTMLNQLNILDPDTYAISPIDSDPDFIVMEDLTDEDSVRVTYDDLGADGVTTQVSAQQEAPSHSGIVTLDMDTYKQADTVIVTLTDPDLNVDSDLTDIFTVVTEPSDDPAYDNVGKAGLPELGFGPLGVLLNITFDDELWTDPSVNCAERDADGEFNNAFNRGLGDTGFTLIETESASGVFVGDFQIPNIYCQKLTGKAVSVTGTDIEVNYVDFRDASGEIIEVGDGAGVRANTGSVSLDRTVYPVPWGNDPNGSHFPLHASADGNLLAGDLTIHVRISDPDFDTSASGEDKIATDVEDSNVGPLKITVSRGSEERTLAYAGGATPGDDVSVDGYTVDDLGEITEVAPDAGVFELDFVIESTDGPDGGLLHQGDILTVEYTDPTDASGSENTVTDSATFDLRNGVLQTDKSVYIIGSDMILTVIEPDWDLDNDAAETYSLDLIEWDSDAGTTSMGAQGSHDGAFDPEPSDLRETGDSTGIFQVVVEIPEALGGDRLERGEEIALEYTDWGPSGSDYVGDEDEDINLTVFTSNFGATIDLDQNVYSWTDKVYITIVAPDHNFDSNLIDEIGETPDDPIRVATGEGELDEYKLVETGVDTGVFSGEVILTGFPHDADGDTTTGDDNGYDTNPTTSEDATGPTDGLLAADDADGVSVSFEFSEKETVIGTALIRWNIGEAQWLEASYPATGQGVLRVIDPDMNLNPEAVDNFEVGVKSDSDGAGIDLTVTETNEQTGIFEGTATFTVTDPSSGHRLRVAEGDTVTAEYDDHTLPDPYKTSDDITISATTVIGAIVPPLERVPLDNMQVTDTFKNTLDDVSVDQQVNVSVDLVNNQDKDQEFAYIIQVQDANGVTVKLDWIDGDLNPGQSFSPSVSWIPSAAGTYTATAFAWESVNNPTALSPQIETSITVN